PPPPPGPAVTGYFWTGANDYVQSVDAPLGFLTMGGGAVGGGGGGAGLRIGEDFSRCSTDECETFGNEPLFKSGGGVCDVEDVELWAFSNL
ncbi:hypothetical protein TeGR_g2495, partial [Tetraparma gracilis]